MGLILVWVVLGPLVGYAIGKPKGRDGEGVLLGFLLGFIGWIIVAAMDPVAGSSDARAQGPRRACPYCAEQIQSSAVVCRYCKAEVEPVLALTAKGVPFGWRVTAKDYQHLQEQSPSAIKGITAACAEAGYPSFTSARLTSAVTDVDKGSLSPQQAVAKWGR